MISLPPGCTINYEVVITLNSMPTEFLVWWQEVGGDVFETEYYDYKGRKQYTPQIKFGEGRLSHKFNDGSGKYLIRFRNTDVTTALALLMKWDNLIESHNMRELEQYVY